MNEFILHKSQTGWSNEKAYNLHRESLPVGTYKVTVESINKRSNLQNAYVHAVLIPEFKKALNEKGYAIRTDEQSKEILKAMFLKENIVNEKTGEVIESTRPTSSLSKAEMNVFIEDVIRFCAENMDYQIPYPNEQLKADL